MKRLIALLALCFACVGQAQAYEDCSTETIDSVSSDGSVVELLDGDKFLVSEIDRIDSALWLPTDDIVVCDPGPETKLIHEEDVVDAEQLY
jgi:hypothetical protein